MQPMENATPTSAYTHASSTQTASTVHAQSTQTKPIVYTQSTKRNRRGGACVPARTPAQRRFHTKDIRIMREGNKRWMHPCRATRAGTQAPPLPISIIFFHTIPYKQNNHLRTIHPNDINRLRTIHPNEIVGAVPACPPERPRSGVSIRMFSYTKLLFTSYKICLHATVEDYQKYNFVSFHTPVHYGQHDPNSYAATTAHRKALNCAASLVLYTRWLSSF